MTLFTSDVTQGQNTQRTHTGKTVFEFRHGVRLRWRNWGWNIVGLGMRVNVVCSRLFNGCVFYWGKKRRGKEENEFNAKPHPTYLT